MNNKKIILAISTNHDISTLIEKNLKHYGFEVLNLTSYATNKVFRYPSLFSRIKVKFRKIFLRDKQAKVKLQSLLLQQQVEMQLENKEFDHALFFLAQNFSYELISYIKTKVKKGGMINYQWDGMQRYPLIYERLPLFDRAYVFDASDLKDSRYNLLPTTSFYLDDDLEPLPLEYDFYFLGVHIPDRAEILSQFAKFAQNMNWKLNFQIVCPKHTKNYQHVYPENIHLLELTETKSYAESLLESRKSKILVDAVVGFHKGLSLRVFEALGHNKKLITTNKDVLYYDFYHPNNIFILENNFEEIEAFLNKPYHYISSEIKDKYSFRNWIKYILDIPPYQPIYLPNKNE